MLLLGERIEQLNTKEITVQDKRKENRRYSRLCKRGPDKQEDIEQLSFDSVVEFGYDRNLDKAVGKVFGSSKGIRDKSKDSPVSSQNGTGEALSVYSSKTLEMK